MKIGVENRTDSPMYVGGMMIPAGETRHFEPEALPAEIGQAWKSKFGVESRKLPDEVLIALGKAAGEVLKDEREKLDAFGKKVWDSHFAARKTMIQLTDLSNRALANARGLDFPYV